MAWFYDRTAPHSGVGPEQRSSTQPEYEFFEVTDPARIKVWTSFVGNAGVIFGPFATLADAQAQATKTPPESGGAAIAAITAPPAGLQVPGLSGLASAASGVTGFLASLTDPHTWIRIAEVILGLVLIAIGVAKLTNAVPIAEKVAGGAAKIGAVAAL